MTGKRGPKSKSPSQKKLQGTFRRDRDTAKSSPMPSKDRPVCPEWMDEQGQAIFAQLVTQLEPMGLASESFTHGLALLAARLAEVRGLTAILEREGSTYQIASGAFRIRPEVAMRSEAMKHAQSLLREFGLSPSGLARIELPEPPRPEAKDNWW